jgi:hypothetical protein
LALDGARLGKSHKIMRISWLAKTSLVNFDPFLVGGVVFHQRQLLLGERGMAGRRENYRTIDAWNT